MDMAKSHTVIAPFGWQNSPYGYQVRYIDMYLLVAIEFIGRDSYNWDKSASPFGLLFGLANMVLCGLD